MKHPKYPVNIVLLFVALGPPLGALTLCVILAGWMLLSYSLTDVATSFLLIMLFALPMSYIVGGIQALIIGIIAGFYVRERQTLSYRFMIILSLLAAALYFGNFYGNLLGFDHTDVILIVALCLAHVLPTIVLTRSVRNNYRRSHAL
ncbi:hypothetical protein FM042_07085 [Aliidiomarina halalkaliphila]|uniref:Uncharacterized protein n=1 Tax=Aliidiomarina halalkaliphila TaxID=2593535 RepID=A0A552X115_9GAMM|nr:hypothetical protein [Aliidiomarina halalkaliphila]TRW48741.1 hypothetical protein FM042_07085 [Aliidiomarina halalkaliphila]